MKEVIIIEYKIVKSNDDKYLYKVYEDGKIYDIVKDRIMPSPRTSNGYIATYIYIEDLCREIGVHRIVLCAFTNKSITYNMQVNHKDGNKENNSLDNLEWVTCSENHRHAYNNGRKASNCWNGKKMPKHTSNYHYVLWDESKKKWMVSIKWKRKNYYVGRYNSEIEAAKAADAFIKANNWDKVLNFS